MSESERGRDEAAWQAFLLELQHIERQISENDRRRSGEQARTAYQRKPYNSGTNDGWLDWRQFGF